MKVLTTSMKALFSFLFTRTPFYKVVSYHHRLYLEHNCNAPSLRDKVYGFPLSIILEPTIPSNHSLVRLVPENQFI